MAADPSSFFRLNEDIARELARLEREGALERLLELLGDADVKLRIASFREREGLEETLGVLEPRHEDAAREVSSELGLSPVKPRLAGCAGGCGEVDAERASEVAAELERPRGGFDFESYMTARSQFLVTLEGEAREVYMPDHLCPSCWNTEGNKISECARVCGRCAFEW